MLRARPSRRAIAFTPIPSARCSLLISAHSSTLITFLLPLGHSRPRKGRVPTTERGGSSGRGQFSTGYKGSVFSRRRHLGLSGVVEADQLRALVDGLDPSSGVELLAGSRPRSVRAFDLTFSAPKSCSLLWALGGERVAEVVAAAHREAVEVALGFLEDRAAVARVQFQGVRRRVETGGWVVAGFVHRTSREGDPQLHTHCLVPNLVRRSVDGRVVAFDAGPLYEWCRAAGSVYQNQLQRALSLRLGVEWGPDRNNTREMAGFG
ncbi:MAG: MobF family relaxase, partial [Acidimicrobiales bacterium]